IYARQRVKELWVVDANTRTTCVHTGPSGDAWSSVVTRGPQDVLTTSALPGFSIRLGEIA
ncbi:MAG TPA: Uma2 family endonuclease, partial [Xanthobacteraceae bacterium]|nr:Uma2 family endonuclease [Xanthobacteraceae bacterium]